jgi:hypothetical protein
VVWLLIDVLLGVIAFSVLGMLLLKLWRQVRSLGAEVSRAGDAIAQATDELARVQAEAPPSA